MLARRLRLSFVGVELPFAALAAILTVALAYAGVHKVGTAGALLPIALVLTAILISRPLLAMVLAVGLTILCEGGTFGIFSFTAQLYTQVYRDISMLDLLVALAVIAVFLDVLRHRRPLWIPRPLALPLATLVLAMLAGAEVGHAAGASLKFAVVAEHTLAYVVLLPLAVANLDIDRAKLTQVLGGLMALAILKAVLGLVEVFGHLGVSIEGSSTLTYYEPAANWLIMVALLAVFGAALSRAKAPRWVLLGSPLLLLALILSYRRSFWIAAALGLMLVLLLGTSPVGRRMLVPAGLAVVAAVWILGSISFQSQLPAVKRLESLSPTKLESNVQDSYRLDERANVLAEIRKHPITGLGMTIPWEATVQPLSIEHEEGRQYVHFAALWFWLKLGLLGLLAYVAIILGSMVLAFQAWRRAREPLLRAFGLASLCGFAGLVAIESTASFTGVDGRFTVLFAAQVGILALIVRLAGRPAPNDAMRSHAASSSVSASTE